jgi:hypothetical protein
MSQPHVVNLKSQYKEGENTLLEEHILRYMAYDPQESVERYPWKIQNKENHELANRSMPNSPTGVSDFDQSYTHFKIDGNPFRLLADVLASGSLTDTSSSLDQLNQIVEEEEDHFMEVYSPRLQDEPEIPATPERSTTDREAMSTPIKGNKLERLFDLLQQSPAPSVDGTEEDKKQSSDLSINSSADEDPRLDSSSSSSNKSSLNINIDDLQPETFSKIMDELRTNLRVTKLRISRQVDYARTRCDQELEVFFETIRTLPNLELLHLSNFEASDLDHDKDDTLDQTTTTSSSSACGGTNFQLKLSDLHF